MLHLLCFQDGKVQLGCGLGNRELYDQCAVQLLSLKFHLIMNYFKLKISLQLSSMRNDLFLICIKSSKHGGQQNQINLLPPSPPSPSIGTWCSRNSQTYTKFHFSPEPPKWVFRIKFGYQPRFTQIFHKRCFVFQYPPSQPPTLKLVKGGEVGGGA